MTDTITHVLEEFTQIKTIPGLGLLPAIQVRTVPVNDFLDCIFMALKVRIPSPYNNDELKQLICMPF